MRNLRLKIALLGDAAVGKTSLRRRFMGKSFASAHLMTIGADFSTTKVEIDGNEISYQIWDIAGAQNFSKLRSQFYGGVRGALCVFDLTRELTFMNISNWITELWQNNGRGEVPIMLLGNKSDLKEEAVVHEENAHQYAKEIEESMTQPFNVSYIQTSAKTGQNVDQAFELLGKEILRTIDV